MFNLGKSKLTQTNGSLPRAEAAFRLRQLRLVPKRFDRLTEISRKYGNDLRKFYQDLADAGRVQKISRDNERSDSEQGYLENEAAPIHLLTATRSKGREFDGVIILDADDTEWPNRQTDDIEEERRLFYVAMSRAKKYRYMVVPYNKLESRFLLEAGLI